MTTTVLYANTDEVENKIPNDSDLVTTLIINKKYPTKVYTYIHIYKCISIFYMFISIYLSIYLSIHIYIHYIYIYTYIYILLKLIVMNL